MRIIKRDLHHSFIRVILEDVDDLWVLYNIVELGDNITSKTTREIKQDLGRPASQRKTMTLTIEVTKIEFDMSLNRLRIQGIIRKCPEEYGIKGSHHTFAIAPGSLITIIKDNWQNHHLERLESAIKSREPVIIVALDADSACVALIRSFKVEIKAEINPDLPGKMDTELRSLSEKKYLKGLAQTLLRILKNSEPKANKILITGPGFLKDSFKKLLDTDYPEVSTKITAVKGGSSGGIAGVYETLRSGILNSLIKESRVIEEISVVEKILQKIGSDEGDVSYGLDQVAEDSTSGTVENLILTVDLLKNPIIRQKVEPIIRDVEKYRGKVMIISTEHEGGHKLSALGGIASLLRYKKHIWGGELRH